MSDVGVAWPGLVSALWGALLLSVKVPGPATKILCGATTSKDLQRARTPDKEYRSHNLSNCNNLRNDL